MTSPCTNDQVLALEKRQAAIVEAINRLADAIASAGYNINTDEMHRAYRAVWAIPGNEMEKSSGR